MRDVNLLWCWFITHVNKRPKKKKAAQSDSALYTVVLMSGFLPWYCVFQTGLRSTVYFPKL